MHIVGLLGMPRRVYTYPGGLGWTTYNMLETIGGFVTLAGILVCLGNLVHSYFRGPRAGPDPWHGPTLEWSVPSPPPEFNFAVVPTVSSAYPNWDERDRAADRRRLERGEGMLDRGHEQMQSTPVDAYPSRIAQLPHSSPWPIVLAFCLSGLFAVLVVEKYSVAAVFAVLAGLTLVAWHSREVQARDQPLRGHPSALFGMGTLIAAEAALFAMMVGTYFYLRFKNLHWPPPGIPDPKLLVPLLLLGVLLASLVPMHASYRAARIGRLPRARLLLLVALVVQAGYFAMEVSLYRDDLHRFAPQTHAYASIYYVLLGTAHAHVAIGLLLSGWLLVKLTGGLTRYRLHALQAIAVYWAAVGVLTAIATLTVLSPAL